MNYKNILTENKSNSRRQFIFENFLNNKKKISGSHNPFTHRTHKYLINITNRNKCMCGLDLAVKHLLEKYTA